MSYLRSRWLTVSRMLELLNDEIKHRKKQHRKSQTNRRQMAQMDLIGAG